MTQVQGLVLLGGMVLLMWVLEIVNTIDSNGLDNDGIWARNFGRICGASSPRRSCTPASST